jgi:hypothetical protein
MEYLMTEAIMEEVTTFDGTLALRKDCRFIKGSYFIKNKQCFRIEDKWYRINSGLVVLDNRTNTYVLSSDPKLVEGIVSINDKGEVELGNFTIGNETVSIFYNRDMTYLLSLENVSNKKFLLESLGGVLYIKGDKTVPRSFYTKTRPRKEGFYSFPFNYGSDELIPSFSAEFDKYFEPIPLKSSAYEYIKNYTFGVEFETDKGAIPEKFIKDCGLIPLRDGSIQGFEYTTIPMQGEIGISALKRQCSLLKKYCSCSTNESLHIHIGGYPKTVKSLAALYRLGLVIQDEIYSLFPYYYMDTSKFKKKGYCNPLPNMGANLSNHNEIFSEFYKFLTGEMAEFKGKFPTGNHPMDRVGQQKWQINSRYVYMNFNPMLWGNRGTIEFRCHTPTVNAQKVINWLFLTVAILEYAKGNIAQLTNKEFDKIKKVTIKDILSYSYPDSISDILMSYFDQRKSHYAAKNDYVGEREIYSEELNEEIFNLIEFV